VPVTTKEIVEVPVEMRTVEEQVKEIKITEQVPFVTEKLVHVPSPVVVKQIEKAVPVVREVPKDIVREILVHEPVQVEIIREVPVEVPVVMEVELLKEKIVTLKEQVIKEVPTDKIVEKEVVLNQVFELTKEVPVPVVEEVFKEIPGKDVIVEKRVEVIREVEVKHDVVSERVVELIKEVRVDRPVPVVLEVIKEVPVYITQEVIVEKLVEVCSFYAWHAPGRAGARALGHICFRSGLFDKCCHLLILSALTIPLQFHLLSSHVLVGCRSSKRCRLRPLFIRYVRVYTHTL
jgi:hypothetical protein